MTEMSIVTPLSGEEILDSIAETVKQHLMRDCYLNPALAYQAFDGEIYIRLRLKDNGREPEIEQTIPFQGGAAGMGPQAVRATLKEVPVMESQVVLEDRPPNVVRQEAGLELPTLVEDARGRKEVKGVRYGQRAQGQGGPGGTQDNPQRPGDPKQQPGDPGQQNPHKPGTPEHEKHEREKKEKEEREKKEHERR